MMRTTSTSGKTRRPGCCCKLNPDTFRGMVNNTINKLYGHLDGHPYSVDDTALISLQEAAESFIETMWTQVKDIMIQDNNRQIIERNDFEVWRRKTGFKLRIKTSRVSLCKLFGQIKKRCRRY